MIAIHVLPGKEETMEILRQDRLNLRAEPVDGLPMNPRE
jgi:hypothetical protein